MTDQSPTVLHEIRKSFQFEAAHRLPNLPSNHKCARLHGHSFKVTLVVRGVLVDGYDWVLDFSEIKNIFKPVLDQLDHHYLNEIPGLENPTSEVLARWIFGKVSPNLKGLHQVILSETCTSESIYPV